MAPHSSTFAWKMLWTEDPGGLQSMGLLRVGHDWATALSRIGEGNGNPLQCSCLENPRDGGAWWAAIYGVAQSWTWLKWLRSSSYLQGADCLPEIFVPQVGIGNSNAETIKDERCALETGRKPGSHENLRQTQTLLRGRVMTLLLERNRRFFFLSEHEFLQP